MPPPRLLLARRLCSTSTPDPAHAPTPDAISTVADAAAAAILRTPQFESRIMSQLPRAVLLHPDCARLTLSRLLPYQVPSLRFLLFLSAHLPAPDAAPEPAASAPLPGLDDFLLRLPPPLTADAADILASRLGLHPSLSALNGAFRAALRAGRPDLVFRLFSAFSSSPAFPGDDGTVTGLARACAAEGRPLDGLRLLRDAARGGSPPSIYAASDIIGAFAADGNFAKVSETLHFMIATGCNPNTIVYQRIIHHLFAHGKGGEALRVFNEIKRRGYDINRVTYTTVIDALSKLRRFGDAQMIWKEMVDKGIEPNQYAYCSLADSYFEAGDFERAHQVYDEMLGKEFKESTVSCNILVKGFCVHGRMDDAFRVFHEMVRKGVEHDVITYNTLIQGLCTVGKLAEALEMYEQLLASGLESTVSTFTPLIDAMCNEGQVDAAVDLFKLMQAKGLEPLVRSNESIIDGFCKINRADDGMAWLAEMLKNNIKPRERTLNYLVESLSSSGRLDDALLVLNIMFKVGFEQSTSACTILVEKLCTGNVSYSHKLDDILVNESEDSNYATSEHFFKQNISLLCKWWWKIEKADGMWQEIIYKKYIRGACISQVKKRASDSPVWSDLLSIRDVYLKNRCLVIGNGKKTDFWNDIWFD
ncbi:hypothetical protein EJB05_06499, partial [Eragrostis curvula]